MNQNRKNWLMSAAIMIIVWLLFGLAVVIYAQWKNPAVFDTKPVSAPSQTR